MSHHSIHPWAYEYIECDTGHRHRRYPLDAYLAAPIGTHIAVNIVFPMDDTVFADEVVVHVLPSFVSLTLP